MFVTAGNRSEAPKQFARNNVMWIAFAFIAAAILKFIIKLHSGFFLDSNLANLGFNYFQFGFVRRGLVGSIVYFSGVGLVFGTYLIYWLSLLLFLLFVYFILRRTAVVAASLVPFTVILAALALFWSTDVGRTDMAVAAILAAAALATIERRILVASLCVGAGVTVHEAVAIYGAPLLVAILFDDDRFKNVKLSTAAIGGAIIVASFVANALIIPMLPHSDSKTIVETIKSEIPPIYVSGSTDQTLYFALAGPRGVKLAQCAIQHSADYFVHPFVAASMFALTIFSLSGRRRQEWVAPILASVPPMVFLWFVATDMSRWTAFGILNIWIVCAVRSRATAYDGTGWTWARAASAAAVLLLLYPSTVSVFRPFLVPSPLIEKLVDKVLGSPTIRTFEECDPTWRSVLTGTDE